MRIISVNLNGIRAAARKGFYDWLAIQSADFICMQETKAQMAYLEDEIFYPKNYHAYFSDAIKKGYSGVGIYSKRKPESVCTTLDWPLADDEGRYVQCDFKNFTVISVYFPSGSSGEIRQALKYEFMDRFLPHLLTLKATGRELVICGDWNIVHKEIDIKNWRSNQKNSGCLPEERAWLDQIFSEVGFVDAFRVVNQSPHQYTWWSNRGQAWANNVGWRIDYQVVTPKLATQITDASIYKAERFSDHAPLTIDYRD